MARAKPKKTFNWFMFLVLMLAVLIFGFLIIYWSVTRPFCANSLSCKESLSLKIENGSTAVFNGQKFTAPNIRTDESEVKKTVLGVADSYAEKHIYVDLTTQTLKAYEGNNLFLKTFISSGRWGRTPTGEFSIWHKVKATRMTGGQGNDYYDLPNVPYVLFFSGQNAPAASGFGLHGTYWHNNFGHPMSHGCVNLRTIDAQKIFDWAPEGTKITIYGKSP